MHGLAAARTLVHANISNGGERHDERMTVDPGPASMGGFSGPAFAQALAVRDFEKLRSLLDREIEFRALTPRRTWEADGDAPTVDLFRRWFDEATAIDHVDCVETHTVGDRQHLVYRFSGHDDGGPFVVEQQIYFTEREGRIDWMRMMCSGFMPQGPISSTPLTSGAAWP
jgi:hypothetical protein